MKFSYAAPDSETDEETHNRKSGKAKAKGKGKVREKEKPLKINKFVQKRQSGFAVSYLSSSGSSSDSSTSSLSSSGDEEAEAQEDVDTHSETDSEEEEYPVGISTFDNKDGRRHLNQYEHYNDPLELYYAKEQQKAWRRAQAAHNRDLAALRTIRLNAFARAEAERTKACEDELELVRLVFQDVDLRRQQEEELIDREFNSRNRQRWDEIDNAISQLEHLQSAAEAQRLKQVKAEQEAKKRREQEEKEIQREEEEKEETQRKKDQEQREQARNAAEERAKNEKEKAAKEAVGIHLSNATLQQQPSSADTTTATLPLSGNTLEDSTREFDRWRAKTQELKTTVLSAVSANPSWRNACRVLKRTLSTRISNISASATDLMSKTAEIHSLLFDSKTNTQTYLWTLNLLSKRIIGMANMNTEADQSGVTYALAEIVIALLCADHGQLAEIFMARLVKRCPYVMPHYPSRGTMALDDFNKLMGRKASESSINYTQRMSGIVSLYAAIVQTSPSSVTKLIPEPTLHLVPAYFRPEGGWRWYAAILRPPLPLLDLTPLLLYNFLRITGERFHQLFGRQFEKLIRALALQGIDGGAVRWNKEVQGDLSKVRILIGEWLDKGKVKGAEGRLRA